MKLPKQLQPIKLRDEPVRAQKSSKQQVVAQDLCSMPNIVCGPCSGGTKTCTIPGGRYGYFSCSC